MKDKKGAQKNKLGEKFAQSSEIGSEKKIRYKKLIAMSVQRIRKAMVGAGLKEPAFERDGFFRTVLCRHEKIFPEIQQTSDVGSTTQKTTQKILELITPTTTHSVTPLMQPVFVSDERDKPDGFSTVSMRQV